MKNLLVLLSIVTISLALTDDQKKQVQEFEQECLKSSGVSVDVLIRVKNGETIDDPNVHSFTSCVYNKLQFTDPNGQVDTVRVKQWLPTTLSEEQKDALINECFSLKGTSSGDTAFKIYKCYKEKSAGSN